MECASKALHGWSSRFSRHSAAPCDEKAELWQLEAQVSPATLDALNGTSELPADAGQAGVRALLQRYLAAEKHDVHNAAQRLEQQAAWRRGFGTVCLVRIWRRALCSSPAAVGMPCSVCMDALAHLFDLQPSISCMPANPYALSSSVCCWLTERGAQPSSHRQGAAAAARWSRAPPADCGGRPQALAATRVSSSAGT